MNFEIVNAKTQNFIDLKKTTQIWHIYSLRL